VAFVTSANSLKQNLRGTLRVGTILDPEFTRLGAFIKSWRFLRRRPSISSPPLSDEVLAQIG
jgi:hypothetical protein